MDPCTTSMPRIPGSFDDDDSDSGDNHEHSHGAFTQQIFIEGPGISIQRTTGVPFPGLGSHPGADGESGYGQNVQSPGTGEPSTHIVEVLQSIFASIMGERNIERVRQEVQNQRTSDVGGNPSGAIGRDPQGDQRAQGDTPPMPGLNMFSAPPIGSRFVYERHAVPPHRHSPAPVEDISSCVPNSPQRSRLIPELTPSNYDKQVPTTTLRRPHA